MLLGWVSPMDLRYYHFQLYTVNSGAIQLEMKMIDDAHKRDEAFVIIKKIKKISSIALCTWVDGFSFHCSALLLTH